MNEVVVWSPFKLIYGPSVPSLKVNLLKRSNGLFTEQQGLKFFRIANVSVIVEGALATAPEAPIIGKSYRHFLQPQAPELFEWKVFAEVGPTLVEMLHAIPRDINLRNSKVNRALYAELEILKTTHLWEKDWVEKKRAPTTKPMVPG